MEHITQEIINEMLEAQEGLWCECDGGGVHDDDIFFDDGVHEEIDKHHWRCPLCHKITQIG